MKYKLVIALLLGLFAYKSSGKPLVGVYQMSCESDYNLEAQLLIQGAKYVLLIHYIEKGAHQTKTFLISIGNIVGNTLVDINTRKKTKFVIKEQSIELLNGFEFVKNKPFVYQYTDEENLNDYFKKSVVYHRFGTELLNQKFVLEREYCRSGFKLTLSDRNTYTIHFFDLLVSTGSWIKRNNMIQIFDDEKIGYSGILFLTKLTFEHFPGYYDRVELGRCGSE